MNPFPFDLSTRTMFTFASGVYVYVIAWALLGQDSGDSLGPTHLSDFAVSKLVSRESHFFIISMFSSNKEAEILEHA